MIFYSYDRFRTDVPKLGDLCAPFRPDTIVAVARGGMSLAHALCMYLNVRNLQSIRVEGYDGESQREEVSVRGECDFSASSRVLIVDDIVDSGRTLATLLHSWKKRYPSIEFKSASLYYKPAAPIQPDYALHEASEWIDFFWERDFLKPDLL